MPKRLAIELFTTGELNASETEELKAHLSDCSVCHDYLGTLTQQREVFLKAHPYQSAFKSASNNPVPNALQWLWGPALRPVLAPALGLCILGLCLLPFLTRQEHSSPSEIIYKSASALSFLVKRNGEAMEGNPHSEYSAGDIIQVLYNSGGREYLTLFSLDTRGNLSFYHNPEAEYCSIKTKKGTRLHYPGSILLDNSPGHELIVALFTAKPRKEKAIRQWVAKIQGPQEDLPALSRKFREALPSPGDRTAVLLLKKRRN
jgi:hypothetical protein